MGRRLGRKSFFFEKKTQKISAPLRACVLPPETQQKNQSFFASFCSQKEVLSSFAFSGTT
jgi:hypothetical protein